MLVISQCKILTYFVYFTSPIIRQTVKPDYELFIKAMQAVLSLCVYFHKTIMKKSIDCAIIEVFFLRKISVESLSCPHRLNSVCASLKGSVHQYITEQILH